MRQLFTRFAFFSCCLVCWGISLAQDSSSLYGKVYNLPEKFFNSINQKSQKLQDQLSRQTEKYLERLYKRESRLKRKLDKLDPDISNKLFNGTGEQYKALIRMIKEVSNDKTGIEGEYLANIDSLTGCLLFLQQNNHLIRVSGELKEKIQTASSQLNQLQSKFHQSERIKEFIRQRKEQIKSVLGEYKGITRNVLKNFNQFSKESYYYSQQIREYKQLLNNPERGQQKLLSLLKRLPAFQQFMKDHGELAGLFAVPANYATAQGLTGLQTRDLVQQLIQNQNSSGGPNAGQIFSQNIQTAQAQLNQFKDKLNQLGGGSGDIEMPDFERNDQRTKTFLKRLEYSSNLQTTKANSFFPTTTDLGLSVGYKLNKKNVIGIGSSYKLGWGKDVRHINLSSEGISFRSFADVRLKGSFYASGGFEYNYQKPFAAFRQLYHLNTWQQSGLIGVSKIISIRSKLFKKTKLQLLWDFLSYRQRPNTQPIKFRVGYNF